MNFRTIFILLFIGLIGCSSNPDIINPDTPDNQETTLISKNNRVIYEVNVLNFSTEGTFTGVEKDLPRLKELGVDILWLMPIYPIGEKNKAGTLGSPYAVKDYKAVNPNFGTLADLKSLVKAAHTVGIEIWLDWVANHTAWDHVWIKDHLDYYAEKNGIRPYSPNDWADVIQLDYNNAAMRTAMIDALKYWVSETDIDGYRCDAASFIPLSFWKEARTEVNKLKNITWLAEADKPEYMEVFDYDYAWEFNSDLNTFGKEKNVATLISSCQKLFNNSAYSSKGRMVFLTNHDLNAYSGTEFERYGDALLPLTVLSFTVYDMPLIYNGQEVGMNKSMGLFDVSKVQWSPVNQTVNNLIKKLTKLKRTQSALESGAGRGTLTTYQMTSDKVFAYSRKKGSNEVLVMLNFSTAPVNVRFNGQAPSGSFSNYLKTESLEFTSQTTITLPANGYAVYVK
jgi:Glycosidases